MAKLVVLGNCSNQTSENETTNFVLDTGEFKLLFDTGPGVIRQLYRAGISATDIEIVIVTHSHGDHTLGFPYFVFSIFAESFQGKSGPPTLPVIALPKVYKGITDMFAFVYPPGKYPNLELVNWEASNSEQKMFKFKNTEITTTPVTHAVPNIGVRFEFNSTKIAFSCDTVYDPRVVELAKGCQILVHEAFGASQIKDMAAQTKHSIAEEAGIVANEAGVKTLLLTHILPGFLDKKKLLIDEASKHYKGKILAPSDLDVIQL